MKLFNWKRRYFKRKLHGVECMIEDLLFKRFKTREIREEIRQEYDNLRSKLDVLDAKIKSQKDKPTMEKEEIARLDDQKVLIERDIERYLSQMKSLDLEIMGSKPTAEYQDGVQGINQQLDSLQELVEMLRSYIKII